MTKPDPIPARLAALKTTPTPDLKQQWRDLFDKATGEIEDGPADTARIGR